MLDRYVVNLSWIADSTPPALHSASVVTWAIDTPEAARHARTMCDLLLLTCARRIAVSIHDERGRRLEDCTVTAPIASSFGRSVP